MPEIEADDGGYGQATVAALMAKQVMFVFRCKEVGFVLVLHDHQTGGRSCCRRRMESIISARPW